MTVELEQLPSGTASPAISPQALLLNFFGGYVLDREANERGVSTSVIIEVCRRVGIGEHAVRSTLNRMVNAGLLQRQRNGRTTVYRLTDRSSTILRDGARRIWQIGAVRADEDAGWTLLAFTMPTPAQRERHRLRTRLMWAGFGPLQAGLWIAPAPADLSGLLADPNLAPHLKVFDAAPQPMTDLRALSHDIWDLDTLQSRYRDFIDRWSSAVPAELPANDPLALHLVLGYEWLGVLRTDPRLPASCLPDNWPAAEAERAFRRTNERLGPAAADEAERILASSGGSRTAI